MIQELKPFIQQFQTLFIQFKEAVLAFFFKYVPQVFIFSICSIILEYPTTPILQLITGIVFIWYWVYFMHRLHHNIPSTGPFYYFNYHVAIHHAKVKVLPRPVELMLEAVQDLVWFFYLYLIQEITNIHIVPNKILLLSATLFTSVHIITYSIVGSEKHGLQHLNPDCNFGPDFLDHIFGTNSDDTFEDMTHYIPNTLILASLIYYFI